MTEWQARRSHRADRILCGRRAEGEYCQGLIAFVQTVDGREVLLLPNGERELEPGLYGPSARARERQAGGQRITPRHTSRRNIKGTAAVMDALEVSPPFRKRCPVCPAMNVVPSEVLVSS